LLSFLGPLLFWQAVPQVQSQIFLFFLWRVLNSRAFLYLRFTDPRKGVCFFPETLPAPFSLSIPLSFFLIASPRSFFFFSKIPPWIFLADLSKGSPHGIFSRCILDISLELSPSHPPIKIGGTSPFPPFILGFFVPSLLPGYHYLALPPLPLSSPP